MSAPALDLEVLRHFLPRIAVALDVPVDRLPTHLNRQQIAAVAGLGGAGSLRATVCRGANRREPRWLAFQFIVGQRKHRIPVDRVAMWLAAEAAEAATHMPGDSTRAAAATAPASAAVAEAPTATPSLEGAFGMGQGAFAAGRLVKLCPDQG